jgi:hypothetical protein
MQQTTNVMDNSGQFTVSTIFKPLSRSDWLAMDSGTVNSNPNSGSATPTDTNAPTLDPAAVPSPHTTHTHSILKSTTQALNKWKRMWDEDMALQYPPTATSSRRFGFCRDAVHFYWMAHAMLRANRMNDWRMPPDVRLMHIMTLLRQVRAYVQTDSAQRGEWLGSVGDIDEGFGVQDLTLDMKQIFRPIDEQYRRSPNWEWSQ